MSRNRLRTRRISTHIPRKIRRSSSTFSSSGLGNPVSPWNLKGKDAYVDPEKRKRLPLWFLPALTVVLIAALIFWGAPAAVTRLRPLFDRGGNQDQPVQTLYDRRTMVVRHPVADMFSDDDLLAARTTQTLYNEPVRLTGKEASFGFIHVRLDDGTEGYMRLDDLVTGHASIEPGKHIRRILVTDLTKRIFSHASNGTLIAEVMMGTYLLSDYIGDGVYRVTLPDGDSGWIGSNGVMELPMDGTTVPLSDSGRYFANSTLAFLNVPYIVNGMTRDGACPEGIARIAAAVNGYPLARSLELQMQAGTGVEVRRDENGDPVYDDLKRGDLVFFSSVENRDKIVQMGIYVDYAQVLTYRTGRSDIRIMSLLDNPSLTDGLRTVRRIFP